MQNKTVVVLSFLFIICISAAIGQGMRQFESEMIIVKGEKIEQQSFMTEFKSFGEVEFAAYVTEKNGI